MSSLPRDFGGASGRPWWKGRGVHGHGRYRSAAVYRRRLLSADGKAL